jgi:hypothetical protein
MLAMPKIRDRNFSKTIRYVVHIRSDRPHSWKHHFRGATAEVVGYLELLSKRDHEWFVWATVDNIVEHCNRYRKGKPYSRAAVKQALELLRKLHVVSPAVERKRKNQANEFQTFTGRVVTPHYAMCEATYKGKSCSFRPTKVLPGHRWATEMQTKNVGSKGRSAVVWYDGPITKST